MHFPSERVQREINREQGSIWYVPAEGSDDLAILVKAQNHTLKALIMGCKLELQFSRCTHNGLAHLCCGVCIYDTPDAPIMYFGVQREQEEHDALNAIVNRGKCPLFLFDELGNCVSWAELQLTVEDQQTINRFLTEISNPYVGELLPEHEMVLDSHCIGFDQTKPYSMLPSMECLTVTPKIENWVSHKNVYYSSCESQSTTIDDTNEGEQFERIAIVALEHMFGAQLYKSPEVTIGSKSRELTDILSYYEQGTFLIEAKNLSVLQAGYERSQERKSKGVIKQVKKAIGQLEGAYKALKRGEVVTDSYGEVISIDRDVVPHCIVLVSEVSTAGDWEPILDALLETSQKTGGLFQVIDIYELILILKASRGEKELFDYNLLERFKVMAQQRSVFLKPQLAT
ncbi:hypothetical protein QX213_21545 [Vibrio vulnificus]|uniref:hypothetical protein n=1 Tax=Vibrio vulnificus TaxID=672 RepID=UPI002879156A|nr:hypothetical protein [Vibrio vulnificus]MDS1846501.1 hypothetical protein [Vibrio vulnificus]